MKWIGKRTSDAAVVPGTSDVKATSWQAFKRLTPPPLCGCVLFVTTMDISEVGKKHSGTKENSHNKRMNGIFQNAPVLKKPLSESLESEK